jgi:hypothetical protein
MYFKLQGRHFYSLNTGKDFLDRIQKEAQKKKITILD